LYGRVLDDKFLSDGTEGKREQNKLAFSDKRVISMIIPLRDGTTISLKI
jgi:hypothetical protein